MAGLNLSSYFTKSCFFLPVISVVCSLSWLHNTLLILWIHFAPYLYCNAELVAWKYWEVQSCSFVNLSWFPICSEANLIHQHYGQYVYEYLIQQQLLKKWITFFSQPDEEQDWVEGNLDAKHAHTHTHTQVHACVCTHTHIHTHARTHMQNTNKQMHTCTHTHTHTQHTHTYATHTHTQHTSRAHINYWH